MRRSRGAIVLAAALTLLIGGLVIVTAGPAPPAIVRELVAVAPAGSKVTLTHLDNDPFGNHEAAWDWMIESDDPRAVIAAYRAWFEAHGIPLLAHDLDGQPLPATELTVPDVDLFVDLDQREEFAEPVHGVIGDRSILPDGRLRR